MWTLLRRMDSMWTLLRRMDYVDFVKTHGFHVDFVEIYRTPEEFSGGFSAQRSGRKEKRREKILQEFGRRLGS